MKILFEDSDYSILRPLTRIRSIFSLRTGIFSELERTKLRHPNAIFQYSHPQPQYQALIAEMEFQISDEQRENDQKFDIVIKPIDGTPWEMLHNIKERIVSDLQIWIEINGQHAGNHDHLKGLNIFGSQRDVFIHPSAIVMSGVSLDVRTGPVIIDADATVLPHTHIEGPAYIGRQTRIQKALITGGCIMGNNCRLGGEIHNSIINDFSNKGHEGYLGHSILGSWVNLGAITTTSDLKNNYGEVKLLVPRDFKPDKNALLESHSTGSIKFGSIIGDCVKTRIGTMLNTGTIIDCGVNVVGERPNKYTYPFTWGIDSPYEIKKFIRDCGRVFTRRGQKVSDHLSALVNLYV